DEVREADLLLHIVDLSHSEFEDHIESVNQILKDIKSDNKPTIMIINKIDAYKAENFDEEDLMIERTSKHYSINEWKKTWMSKVGENNSVFISATEKKNFEELRQKVYEAVRKIHISRFPYNNFLYPEYGENDANEE